MKYITAFFMAWGNFFAVPCPCKLWDNELRRLQLVFLPLIGIIMGALWYLLYLGMAYMGMAYMDIPMKLQSVALTVYPFLISGFIHLDGFMDCSDAILSRRDLEERQRILKDSNVGAFAVISVIILFLVCYTAMEVLLDKSAGELPINIVGLVYIPIVSRCCSSYGVLKYKPIGHSQYNASFDRNINRKYEAMIIILFIAVLMAAATSGYMNPDGIQYNVAIAMITTAATHYLMMLYGRTQLGGMSGDVAGYALTVAECVGVLTLAVV